MRITIADVAVRAGVSKTTVSRVLNAKDDLDARTAARVRQVIEELGYVPSSGRGRPGPREDPRGRRSGPVAAVAVDGRRDPGRGRHDRGLRLRDAAVHLQSRRRVHAEVRLPGVRQVVRRVGGHRARRHAGLHREPARRRASGGDDRRPGAAAAVPVGGHHQLGMAAAPPPSTCSQPGAGGPSSSRVTDGWTAPPNGLEGFASAFDEAGLPVDPELVVDGEFTFEGGRLAVERLLAAGLAVRRRVRPQRPLGRGRDAHVAPPRTSGAARTSRSSASTTSSTPPTPTRP